MHAKLSSLIIMWRLYLCSVFHYRTFFHQGFWSILMNWRYNLSFILYILLIYFFQIDFSVTVFSFGLIYSCFFFCKCFSVALYRTTVCFSSCPAPLFVSVQELFLNDKYEHLNQYETNDRTKYKKAQTSGQPKAWLHGSNRHFQAKSSGGAGDGVSF